MKASFSFNLRLYPYTLNHLLNVPFVPSALLYTEGSLGVRAVMGPAPKFTVLNTEDDKE